jgi:hypothetical protein
MINKHRNARKTKRKAARNAKKHATSTYNAFRNLRMKKKYK